MGCFLALTMLLGMVAPLVTIANDPAVVIDFLNPLAEFEPNDQMPVASREPIKEKLRNNEDIEILAVSYAKEANPEVMLALAWMVKEDFESNEPGTTGFEYGYTGTVTVTLAFGGTAIYVTGAQGTQWSWENGVHSAGNGTANTAPHYWKNQNDGLGRPPWLGNPWGPKTGYGYTGYGFYEQMFERYANWASYDTVLFGIAD